MWDYEPAARRLLLAHDDIAWERVIVSGCRFNAGQQEWFSQWTAAVVSVLMPNGARMARTGSGVGGLETVEWSRQEVAGHNLDKFKVIGVEAANENVPDLRY